jgi:hypothetical protein
MTYYRESVKRLLAGISTALLASLLFVLVVSAQSIIDGTVNKNANLRAGPGTTYAIVGTAKAGQIVPIIEENAAGTWYHLDSGEWIAKFLVDVDVSTTPAPPTATPLPGTPTATPTPAPTVAATATPECIIKGNISYNTGERIYHVPSGAYYDATVINTGYGERWFCSEAEAQAAGWRKSKR